MAMVKLKAYQKVVASIKRMHESSERTLADAKATLAKAGGIEVVSPQLKQKVLEAQAASDAYTDACLLVAKAAKECK